MTQRLLADSSARISEFKQNPMAQLKQAKGRLVVMRNSQPAFYAVEANIFEAVLDELDELRLATTMRERADGPFVDVELDAL